MEDFIITKELFEEMYLFYLNNKNKEFNIKYKNVITINTFFKALKYYKYELKGKKNRVGKKQIIIKL